MDDELLPWLRDQIAAAAERTRTGYPFNNGKVHDAEGWWVEPNGEAWHTSTCGWRVGEGLDNECTCPVPAAVLAQCEAHTRILDEYETVREHWTIDKLKGELDLDSGLVVDFARLTQMARFVALAYQHNPGYREEWRP